MNMGFWSVENGEPIIKIFDKKEKCIGTWQIWAKF